MKWTREQDLAVLYLKLEYEGQLTVHQPVVGFLAKATNHTEASIVMRKLNFDSLDPMAPSGLSNAAKMTRDIWAEYEREPARIVAEARRAYLALSLRRC